MSYQHGAGNGEEKRSLFRKDMRLTCLIGIAMFVAAQVFAEPVACIFVSYDQGLYDLSVERSESTARPICSWASRTSAHPCSRSWKTAGFPRQSPSHTPEFTLYAGWKAAPATAEPGAGDNGNNGDNGDNGNNGNNGGAGDSSSANANVNVNTVNNNGDKASSEAKMATVKTGDNLALVGGAIAVIAVAAAGVAAFALRRRKMN